MQRLRTIFASFFKIGLFTFGGGYAMLPLIEQELIAKRGYYYQLYTGAFELEYFGPPRWPICRSFVGHDP